MASRGFEFAYDLNQSTPVIKDLTLGDSTAYLVGDIGLIQSDGYIDKCTTSTGEVTGVCMESVAAADVSSGVTEAKFAIVTNTQVWRCSMDEASVSGVVGYTKTQDTVDANTLDADGITAGSLILYDVSKTDSDGNVLAYVMFSDVTFGAQDTDTT